MALFLASIQVLYTPSNPFNSGNFLVLKNESASFIWESFMWIIFNSFLSSSLAALSLPWRTNAFAFTISCCCSLLRPSNLLAIKAWDA